MKRLAVVALGALVVIGCSQIVDSRANPNPTAQTDDRKRGEQVMPVKKFATPQEKVDYEKSHPLTCVSVSQQDSVLWEGDDEFSVVGFVLRKDTEEAKCPLAAEEAKCPLATAPRNPFMRAFPAESVVDDPTKPTKKWRASSGPARPEAIGCRYNVILAGADGKPIDPHIEVTR